MKNLFEKSLCKESLACIWHPTISRLDESTFTSLSPIANHDCHHHRHQLSLSSPIPSSRSSLGSLHIIFFDNYFCPNYLLLCLIFPHNLIVLSHSYLLTSSILSSLHQIHFISHLTSTLRCSQGSFDRGAVRMFLSLLITS